jgi:hypothetical protein
MLSPNDFSAAPSPRGGVICVGKHFPSDADARTWLAAAIERRGKLRGKPIETLREFFGDDRQRQKMTRVEDVERQNWSIPMPTVERDPFDDMRGANPDANAKPGSRARYREAHRMAREQYEERLEREAPPSDEVLKLRQWAYDVWEQTLMSDADEFTLARAEHLKRWANTDGADLSGFRDAARQFTKSLGEKRLAKAADLQARRSVLERELASLPPAPVAPDDTPGVPHGYKVKKLRSVDGEVSYSVVANEPNEHGGYHVHAEFSETNAPAEIVSAAT